MKKYLLFTAFACVYFLLSCSNSGTSGFTLTGNVISGGTPLSGVSISVSHPHYGTFTATTDSDGDFSLSDLWDGEYVITPAKEGFIFEPSSVTVSIKGNIENNFTGILTWTRIIAGLGRARASSVKQTSDGGYIVSGYIDTASTAANGYDFWIIKLDQLGNVTWEKKYGGQLGDFAYSVTESFNPEPEGYVIAGISEITESSYDIRVIKVDGNGNIIWNNLYGGVNSDEIFKIIQSPDGGYVLTGCTKSYNVNDGYYDLLVLKVGSNGTEEGRVTFSGSGGYDYDDYGYDICLTPNGEYVVVGGTRSYPEAGKITKGMILKYDSTLFSGGVPGMILSSDGYEEEFRSIYPAVDGGFIITGHIKISEDSAYDQTLIKTDSNGNIEWRKVIDGPAGSMDMGFSVVQTIDGGYAAAGGTFVSSSDNDMALIKFDPSGDVLWRQTYGGLYNDFAYSLMETSDSGFIIAGYTEAGSNNDMIWILKTDRTGIIYGYNDNE